MKITSTGIEASGDINIKSLSGSVNIDSPEGTVQENSKIAPFAIAQRSLLKTGENKHIGTHEYMLVCHCLEMQDGSSLSLNDNGKIIFVG